MKNILKQNRNDIYYVIRTHINYFFVNSNNKIELLLYLK